MSLIWQPSVVNATPTPTALPGRPCSVAASLALVGEKWSLLAVRELSFGNHRFDAIVRNTGAPRDRLAARLRALEEAGVVERRQYSERPPRFEYHLTPSGKDLQLVLQALRAWGDRWAVDSPPGGFVHASCRHDLDVVLTCRHCREEVPFEDVRASSRRPGWDRRGPVPVEA